jgi:hypothetical protein
MAIVNVSGTVGRTFFDGKGAEVVESWTQAGETRTKRWAAFFDEAHGLREGDVVEVSGMHGDKVDEWEKDGVTRHTVKRTINKARLKGQGGSQSAPAATGEVWATPTQADSSVGYTSDDTQTPF